MRQKKYLNPITKMMAIVAGVLILIIGTVFYITFEPPIITVVLPKLDAFQAWTIVAMVLGGLIIAVAVVAHFTPKKKWWNYILIITLVLSTILEITLIILLFKNTSYIENSTFLLVLSFCSTALYMISLVTLSIETYLEHMK